MRRRKIRFLGQSYGAGTILDEFKRRPIWRQLPIFAPEIEFSAFSQDRQLRKLNMKDFP